MSIDALTQAKSTLEGVRGALGIYSKTEVDMTLGMLDRAIANYTDLDAICQDLQEMTYTQAMRIAELEAKLLDKQQFTNVVNPSIHAGSGEKIDEKHNFHHGGIEQKPYGYLKLSNGKFYVEVVGVPDLDCNPDYLPLHTHPQPKQEPVAWQVYPFDYGIGHEGVYARTDRLEQVEAWKRKGWNVQPLYTHPYASQPKGQA